MKLEAMKLEAMKLEAMKLEAAMPQETREKTVIWMKASRIPPTNE